MRDTRADTTGRRACKTGGGPSGFFWGGGVVWGVGGWGHEILGLLFRIISHRVPPRRITDCHVHAKTAGGAARGGSILKSLHTYRQITRALPVVHVFRRAAVLRRVRRKTENVWCGIVGERAYTNGINIMVMNTVVVVIVVVVVVVIVIMVSLSSSALDAH